MKRLKTLCASGSAAAKKRLRRRANHWFSFAPSCSTGGAYALSSRHAKQDAMDAGGITRRVMRLSDGEVVWS
jgi:hypothetical protein